MTRMTDIFFGLIAEKMSVVVFQPVCKVQAQFQTTEEAVYGLHVRKVVIVIYQFQQQFMFWLVAPESARLLRTDNFIGCTWVCPRHIAFGKYLPHMEKYPPHFDEVGTFYDKI